MTRASTCEESRDELLGLLANARRRKLLGVLSTGSTEKTVEDVVDRLVAESGGVEGARADRRRVESELHHKHLPALDAHCVVDYNEAAGTVTYVPGEEVQALIDLVLELDDDP